MLKGEAKTLFAGIIMIIFGLILFYSIPAETGMETHLRTLKHIGTFVGLMGIGVLIAGILLSLIGRNQLPLGESKDV